MSTERIDTRQHILLCGRQLAAAKGFVGVGLSEILATAKVPKGSFYHYFPSKEAFGDALLETYFADYLERVDELFAKPGRTGSQQLLAYFKRWIETQTDESEDERCLIVKLAAEVSDLSEPMRHTMHEGTEAILKRLAASIAQGQADGSIPTKQEPGPCARWLYQAWLGASLLAKLQRKRAPLDLAMTQTRHHLGLH